VEAFCLPLPVVVICELLGVPLTDRERFTRWSEALMSTTGPVDAAHAAPNAYTAGLVAAKRADPGDDLLGELVSARDDAGRLTEEELVDLDVRPPGDPAEAITLLDRGGAQIES
jgi:cytochrome P450